ncbi:MMPL family transporter [Kitasatospora purpeofusca]|uniref:MMPL family transporter n=1 Tax=Kitasatospora purpeofusca TaxID=67352 RepID=UPI00225107AF|nr:MMPL family transporter [Kitasatospora purpeofusca]MCX4752163.1 MMPL family transporter [Kitasatospora purpeofusca]WSR31759.1 MMPL family transporter [Kitasatospora purpeofusca]WSR39783.1 MMPL family transporter [Kitasatospora purpeofusca]
MTPASPLLSDAPASADPRVAGRLAALGRFCYRQRRWVLGFWAVVLVIGVLIGGRVFEGTVAGASSASAESDRGSAVVAAADPARGTVTAVVDGRPVDDAAVRDAVTRATAEIAALPGVSSAVDAYGPGPGAEALRSADGTASAVSVRMADSSTSAQSTAVTQRLAAIQPEVQPGGGKVTVGGDLVLQDEVKKQTEKDTRFGEIVTLPLTLIVMVLVFGGLAAASLPVIGAVASVGGALLAMFGFSKIMDIDTSVLPIATVLGLGLSIDYALLMVNRFREERGHGASISAAVERTAATAGRTVAFSGLTVAVALSGLFVFTSPVLGAVAAAGVSVVVIAVAAALTLVPALLGFAGRRIRTPTAPVPDEGFFSRTVRRVRKRAVLVALVCTGVLMAAGAPFLHAEMRNSGAAVLPASSAGRQVAETIDQRFPQASAAPITVVVQSGATVAQAYADDVVAGLPGVSGVRAVTPVSDTVSTIDVLVHGDPQGGEAKQVVKELRADRGGLTTQVTGGAASVVDFQDELLTRGPIALGLVALGTLILLFLMTGSVVMPVKALLMNLLSLGASLGALTLVFQDGWFSGLLGFSPTGGLETFIPVLVFAFAFGLSMDYEVFLLARIKELRDKGHSCTRAVELGVQRSGRIITSAALLMVIVFAGFALGDMLMVKQMGIALAVAVAVDATLVRCLLVPAAMSFFGEFNWWAPRPLRRLHDRFGLSEHVELPELAPAVLPTQRPAEELVGTAS